MRFWTIFVKFFFCVIGHLDSDLKLCLICFLIFITSSELSNEDSIQGLSSLKLNIVLGKLLNIIFRTKFPFSFLIPTQSSLDSSISLKHSPSYLCLTSKSFTCFLFSSISSNFQTAGQLLVKSDTETLLKPACFLRKMLGLPLSLIISLSLAVRVVWRILYSERTADRGRGDENGAPCRSAREARKRGRSRTNQERRNASGRTFPSSLLRKVTCLCTFRCQWTYWSSPDGSQDSAQKHPSL